MAAVNMPPSEPTTPEASGSPGEYYKERRASTGSVSSMLSNMSTITSFPSSGTGCSEEGLALCNAAAAGNMEELQSMLQSKVDPNLLGKEGCTPLHLAVTHGRLEAVRVLLEHDSDPNIPDRDGLAALDVAKTHQKSNIAEVLQAAGAQSCLAVGQGYWAINDVQQLKIMKKLGETIKSKVYVGKWQGLHVVAKVAKPNKEDENDFTKELLHEIGVLAQLQHPDLVKFLGAQMQDPLTVFLEYMPGGDLQRHYTEKRAARGGAYYVAPRSQVIRWSSQVARALAFLHGRRIIHRDLKPMNLLMSKDHRDVKVTDFGTCKITPPTFGGKNTGGVGTWRYMAPEIARHNDYNEKADIYALALIMFFMSAGKEPYYEKSGADWMLQEFCNGKEPRPQACECQPGLHQIVSDAWHIDPACRPPANELVQRLSDITPLEPGCAPGGCIVA